jgi:uncharacterized membrane protein
MNDLSVKKDRRPAAAILFFGLIYCSISLVNHYNFRTYAWDLGINNNALYDYARFRWNDCMIMQPQFTNVLSDHFSLLPILASPFSWIFGSYTMLILQIAGILLGGYGLYRLVLLKTGNATLAFSGLVQFYSIFGIYSALGFDYHDNVMGAMFVPWIFYYFEKSSWPRCILFTVLLLISKENMALWSIFIFLGIAALHLKDKKKLLAAVAFSIFGAVYFAAVVKLIIPSLANGEREYLHLHYSALGRSFAEVLQTLVTKPWYSFKLLFVNHLNDPDAYGIKRELHTMVLLSGGVALIFRPQYLIMLIPIYAQKLFNDSYGKWGINAHYSIEFVPILSTALFTWLGGMRIPERKKVYLALIFTVLTLGATIKVLDSRVSKWYIPENSRFYQKSHYVRDFNVKKVHASLRSLPDNAPVSAQSMLVPHLSFRDYIYQFPVIGNAEYIVLNPLEENTYPLSREEYEQRIRETEESVQWDRIKTDGPLIIFKKRKQ